MYCVLLFYILRSVQSVLYVVGLFIFFVCTDVPGIILNVCTVATQNEQTRRHSQTANGQ